MHPSCDTRARKGISAARRFEAGDRFAKVRRPNGTLRCVGKRFSHHAARRPPNRKRDARRLVPDRAAAGCPRAPAVAATGGRDDGARSEEHTSELQSLMRISYAVFCLKKKNKYKHKAENHERDKKTYNTEYKLHTNREQPHKQNAKKH